MKGRILPDMGIDAVFDRLCYLMHGGEFARLAGMAEAGREACLPHEVLADTLLSLLAAIGHMALGNTRRAEDLVEYAASRAMPDGFVYLFAVYYWVLRGFPEKLVSERYPQYLNRFLEIKERFISGYTALHNDMLEDKWPGGLTAREREVAQLAALGLRNGEIAEKLMITENTVRFHLRTVFHKLDIDRRAKLAEKLK